MARIFVHIGTHKTASTHIQDTFFANRSVLKKNGIIFPRVGKTHGQHGLASRWINLPSPYAISNPERAWRQLIGHYSKTDHDIFISSEEFSRIFPSRVNMAELRSMLSSFDEIKVICVLRNQAAFIQSVYQQISTERHPGPWGTFIHEALKNNFLDGLSLNYIDLYNHLRSGFPTEEIRFLSYERASASKGGIIGAVLREMGSSLDAEILERVMEKNSNVSPQPLATLVSNSISYPTVARRGLVGLADRIWSEVYGRRKGIVFSRTELQKIRQIYSDLNFRLETEIRKTQPKFKMAPVGFRGIDPVFRGQISEAFWIKLLSALAAHKAE